MAYRHQYGPFHPFRIPAALDETGTAHAADGVVGIEGRGGSQRTGVDGAPDAGDLAKIVQDLIAGIIGRAGRKKGRTCDREGAARTSRCEPGSGCTGAT